MKLDFRKLQNFPEICRSLARHEVLDEAAQSEWYMKRWSASTAWYADKVQRFGARSLIEIKDNNGELSSPISTMINVIPHDYYGEKWTVEYSNWGDALDKVIVRTGDTPVIAICPCEFYSKPWGTVTIKRVDRRYDYKMYGYQTPYGYYVTSFPAKVKIGDIGISMWNRIRRRMDASIEILEALDPDAVDDKMQNIYYNCRGPHEAKFHERFCCLCRGEVNDSRTLLSGNRVCSCENIGTQYQTCRRDEPPGSPIRRSSESEDL